MKYVIAAVVIVAFMVYGVVDVIMTEKSRTRGLPKALWVIVALIPVIGGILWFTIGKDRGSKNRAPRSTAPDDDPEFLKRIGSTKEQEERIRRLEQELADLDDDTTTKD